MKRRRRLRPDEVELWAKVIETATPKTPETRPAPAVDEAPAPAKPVSDRLPLPSLFRQDRPAPGKVTLDLRPNLSDRLAAQRVDMDRKKFGKLKRGKLSPEGRIDLHGMTQAEAHSALTGFILMSHQMGRRLVLVITGKGPGREMGGILRQQVPHWLNLAPLKPLVLQLAEAHRSHGGAGAIYVYLKRNRDG